MAKVKGWRLIRRTKEMILWKNTHSKFTKKTLMAENIGGVWMVTERINDYATKLIGYPLKSKKQAEDVAIRYMKKHLYG